MVEDQSPDLSRVVVVGTSCSGKTTFARDLAAKLGVDHIELDSLSWLPNWVERDRDAFTSLVDEQSSGSTWVIDGNYSRVRDLLWSRATAIIWLNYSFPLTFWRSIKRTLLRSATGQKICNGNRETFRKAFLSSDSILLWVITSYRRRKRDYRTLFDSHAYNKKVKIELTRPADATAFLQRIGNA